MRKPEMAQKPAAALMAMALLPATTTDHQPTQIRLQEGPGSSASSTGKNRIGSGRGTPDRGGISARPRSGARLASCCTCQPLHCSTPVGLNLSRKHYWNAHKIFICGDCFTLFDTGEERASHTKESSHCFYCFTSFPKAPDARGRLHHSNEYIRHQQRGCARLYRHLKRDEYRWRKCAERIVGQAAQHYDPCKFAAQLPRVR